MEDVSAVTKDGNVRHSQVSRLAVLQLAYNSYDFERENLDKIFAELDNANVDIISELKVEVNALDNLTKPMIFQSKRNIERAREELVLALHDQWPPRENQSGCTIYANKN